MGNLPGERTGPRQRAQHERSDEGTTADAERNFTTAGQRDGQLRQEESDCQAGGEAEGIDFGQTAVGVAQSSGHVTHLLCRPDHADPVSQPKHEVAVGHQIGVATTHSGRHRTEPAFEVDVAQPGAGQLPSRDRNPSEVELLAVEGQVAFASVAGPVDEPVDGVGIADDGAQIAGLEHDLVRGEINLCVVFDTREGQSLALPRAQFAQRRKIVTDDDHGGAGDLVWPGSGWLR